MNNMPKIKKGVPLLPIVMALILLNPLFSLTQPIVYAQTSASDYVVLAPLPCIESPAQTVTLSDGTTQNVPAIKCKEGSNGSLQKTVSFQTYVQYTINLLIALSAVAAVFMIVWGGIEYMTSGSFQKKSDGKDRITNAIYGLILVLSSYLILRTIDPRLVEVPNTLVPQISLKPELTVDSTAALMNQMQKQADEYKIKGEELKVLKNQASAEMVAAQKKVEEIDSKIANLDMEKPEDVATLEKLKVERAKAVIEENKISVDYTILLAKKAINDNLINANSPDFNLRKGSVFDLNLNGVANTLKNLEDDKALVKGIQKSANLALKNLQQSDTSTIDNQAAYANSIIDLAETRVMVVTADLEKVSAVSSGFNDQVYIQDVDGKRKMMSPPSEAHDFLMKRINIAASNLSLIKDESLKNELNNKIQALKTEINANPIFK